MASSDPRPYGAPTIPGTGVQPVVVIQSPGQGWWGRKFSWFGWIGLGICIPIIVALVASRADYLNSSEGLQEKFVSGELASPDKIAIIDVSGIISDGDGVVKRQINRVRKDETVKAVVVRINSPGGTVTGSDYIYHHLRKLREDRQLPMVVSMGGIAASGGYYVAMAVGDQPDSIFAEQTTTTGSIGVIIPHYDVSGLLERWDIKDDSLASHPRKKLLSITQEMSADHREVLTRYLNQAFDRFKEVVESGRPTFRENQQSLVDVATGEIFSAPTAKELGLIDRIGFVEDAVSRAAELADLDPETCRVVRYESPLTLMGALGIEMHAPSHNRLESLVEMATPRAYYLSTMFPWILSTYRAESW